MPNNIITLYVAETKEPVAVNIEDLEMYYTDFNDFSDKHDNEHRQLLAKDLSTMIKVAVYFFHPEIPDSDYIGYYVGKFDDELKEQIQRAITDADYREELLTEDVPELSDALSMYAGVKMVEGFNPENPDHVKLFESFFRKRSDGYYEFLGNLDDFDYCDNYDNLYYWELGPAKDWDDIDQRRQRGLKDLLELSLKAQR